MDRIPIFFLMTTFLFTSCGGDDYIYTPIEIPDNNIVTSPNDEPSLSDKELLDLTQRETFKYFWDFAEENSGGARERYHPNDPNKGKNVVTSGGSGFGLMAILVGIERGFITREQGLERLTNLIDFLENTDRFHGAWSHWINGSTGSVIPFSEKDNGGDLVETAYLAQGLICVKEFFEDGTDAEKELASKADNLWKGVEWNWYTQNKNSLYWHWSPNYNFEINLKLKGYNEVLITYVMAAASPDYGIAKEVYSYGWASNGDIKSTDTPYNIPLLVKHAGNKKYGGPLFWAHYSYLGLDPNGLSDGFVNYWDVNVNHATVNYLYCVENPKNYIGYGSDCWGLTSSYSQKDDGTIGYRAHHPGNDIGVISPTAAISSIPYTPKKSLQALHYFYKNDEKLLGPAGFYDAFSPQYNFWVAKAYLAIDQGPIIVMIENYRTGLLWNLFMKNEDVRAGLDKLGFQYIDR